MATSRRSPRPGRAGTPELHLVACGAHLAFVHDAVALAPASVARMAGHLAALLAGRRDTARVAELPLLAPAEGAWLDAIARGEDRPVACGAGAPPRRGVRAHDARWRSRCAIATTRSITRSLDLRARASSRTQLVARGAAGEHVVVCVEPSIDTVVAMLAVWKAGGVYVPLDPEVSGARGSA